MAITAYLFLIIITVEKTLCNNLTQKYNTMDFNEVKSKQHRLLTFDTMDNGDISMELAFNVPFITIPVKKSVDLAQGAIANVNIGAILLGGAMLFGFGVLLPGILIFMSKKTFGPLGSNFRSEESRWWKYVNVLDQLLTENNIDSTSCMQKMVCHVVQNSTQNVNRGPISSSDKIIHGLATSSWFLEIIQNTVFYSAVQHGLGKKNCLTLYSQCNISDTSLKILYSKLLQTFTV